MTLKLPRLYRSLPEVYQEEFLRIQTSLFNGRIRFFCWAVTGLYVLGTVLTSVLLPRDFHKKEILLWAYLAGCVLLILFLNRRTHTLRSARLNAYLFTALILVFLSRLCTLYPGYLESSVTIFTFMLFLVSFTLPWTPLDVFFISLMHFGAYTLLFALVQKYYYSLERSDFNMVVYFRGVIFMTMTFLLCVVIRRKELQRNIQNFLLLKDVENKNRQMEQEFELATRVHKTLMPKSSTDGPLQIAAAYLPMLYMGGDYARFHFLDPRRAIFIISDVTGHGVSAALFVNRMHTEFEVLAKEGRPPGELLKELNNFIINNFEETQMYLSAFCCLLDLDRMRMQYSNHGHPSQYLYSTSTGTCMPLASQGGLLGLPPWDDGRTHQEEAAIGPGDALLLFTDGLIEARNPEGEEYGAFRIMRFIERQRFLAPGAFTEALVDDLKRFNGRTFEDDIFVLNVKVK